MTKNQISRRDFLKTLSVLATTPFVMPRFNINKRLSRQTDELSILLWSHFVPLHDVWFDVFVQEWGEANGIRVTVDHIALADLPGRAAAEINAGEGHDLIEYLSPPAALEPSLLDLTDLNQEAVSRFGAQIPLATSSTFNPFTNVYYGFCHGWVPDPGNYRRSLWEQVDMADGPVTWQDLLEGGSRVLSELGIQMGIGMSQELDSNMAARALLWSFGASIQDEDQNVVINSPEALEAVAYMKSLYEGAMTPEVFGWTAASNNQLLIAGQASYILNSISAYRTSQKDSPEVAADVYFTPALKGPGGLGVVSTHVIPIYMIPQYATNVENAKAFILSLVENYKDVVYNSELYNFPAFPDTTPDLVADGGWLDEDPFGSEPSDKLKVLKNAPEWSAYIGYPGPASPAEGEVFATFILPNMMAKVAQGDATPEEAVADAEAQIIPIFEKWREQGLIGGSS